MQTLLEVILPVFLVIGSGYLLTLRQVVTAGGIDGIMQFSQSIAIPCLLFVAIARLDLGAGFAPNLLFSFYTGAFACFCLGLIGARRIFGRDWEDSIAIGFCCLFSNSVLLGLAITERAYGADAMAGNYAIVALHSPFCYGVGITAMEIARNRGKSTTALITNVLKSMFQNVLVIAILLGFLVNLTQTALPGVLSDALDLISRAALPAALFALGGVLYQYRPEGDAKTIAMICLITLLIHPLIVIVLGRLTNVAPDLLRSGVLTAAMAPGVNAYIFANMYGRAKRVAASSVLISTGLVVVSAWIWLIVLG